MRKEKRREEICSAKTVLKSFDRKPDLKSLQSSLAPLSLKSNPS